MACIFQIEHSEARVIAPRDFDGVVRPVRALLSLVITAEHVGKGVEEAGVVGGEFLPTCDLRTFPVSGDRSADQRRG